MKERNKGVYEGGCSRCHANDIKSYRREQQNIRSMHKIYPRNHFLGKPTVKISSLTFANSAKLTIRGSLQWIQ